MNVMIHQQAEREAQRVQANREELVERIGHAIREDGTVQPPLNWLLAILDDITAQISTTARF